MSLLHYKLSRFGPDWVLFCEDVPVESFSSRVGALRYARRLIALAGERGDMPVLQTDKVPPSHMPAPDQHNRQPSL